MQECWNNEPSERPNFDTICEILAKLDHSIPDKTQVELMNESGGDALDSLLS